MLLATDDSKPGSGRLSKEMDDEPYLPSNRESGAAPAAILAGSAGAVTQQPKPAEA